MRPSWMIVAMLLVVARVAVASPVVEVGAGLGRLGATRGDGESLTKHAVGPIVDLDLGWRVGRDALAIARLTAFTGIEDEQHAHDHVMLAGGVRFGNDQFWFDIGAGLAMYRGRYRDQSFWSAEQAYDFDLPALGVVGAAGVVVHRGDGWLLDVHLDLALTSGGEVSRVSVIGLALGIRTGP